jgi:hypothetical protein
MRTIAITFVSAFTALLLAGPAIACQDGKVLMEDAFKKLNPAWGFPLDTLAEKVGEQGYVATFPKNNWRRGLSQLSYYDDVDVCVNYRVEFTCTNTTACESNPAVGVVFWAADWNNLYTFKVAPPFNTYSLFRLQRGKLLQPITWTPLPGAKIESGKPFEIEVVTKGANAVFYIDGTKVTEFDGLPPDGGSLVGFEIGNGPEDKAPSIIGITKYAVRLPPG